MEITIMTADYRDDDPNAENAEVVPLRPDAGPDNLPAVPAEPADVPAETGPPAETRPAIYADITGQPGERRDIIPAALHRENLRGTVATFTGLQWHRARYHGLRLVFYALAAAVFALVGAIRLAMQQIHWWWVLEQHELRSEAAAAGDSREWLKLHREAKQTRKVRGWLLAAELAGLGVVVAVLVKYAPWWARAGAAAVALPLLAVAGRPDGRRIIAPAVVPPRYQPITRTLVSEALGSLGNANINKALKDGPGIAYLSDPYQSGPGWGVQFDLPQGVTAAWLIAHRRELASGLRRPLSATWPEGVPEEHEGRVDLWVGFHDVSKMKSPKHPLLKSGTTDIFAGVPFGTDPRLRPVSAPMFEVNWLIGAAPGQGKTNVVRNLAAAVSLDLVADMWIHEQAGKGDLEPFAQVCHRYCSGLDDEAVSYAAESARMLRAELERRSKLFGQLPKEAKPEGKLTRDLAVRSRKLRPIIAFFDECQNLLMHPELGEQAADDLAYVIRLGRAYGIIVVLATQRPDKVSLPTQIRGIVTARFCLKVPDYDCNDMILGTGSYKAGYDAVVFRAKTDAGMGWLRADGDPQVVRTYKLDLDPSAKIAARARALRERAGVLTGYALGLDDDQALPRDVLADLLAVFGEDPGMHWGVAADRLAQRFPDRWADATAEALSAQCRSLGVKSVDVRMDGSVVKGCRRVAVEQARQ
jgi:DNA segregation ATPase FtsK/SpoIIIE, S-DNA-T family